MCVRPGQRHDYCEHQRIGGDIEIKVGQAVHENCHNTPYATQRDGFVETLCRFPVPPGGLGEHPEDRAKRQNSARQTEVSSDLQVVAVRMLNEDCRDRSASRRCTRNAKWEGFGRTHASNGQCVHVPLDKPRSLVTNAVRRGPSSAVSAVNFSPSPLPAFACRTTASALICPS